MSTDKTDAERAAFEAFFPLAAADLTGRYDDLLEGWQARGESDARLEAPAAQEQVIDLLHRMLEAPGTHIRPSWKEEIARVLRAVLVAPHPEPAQDARAAHCARCGAVSKTHPRSRSRVGAPPLSAASPLILKTNRGTSMRKPRLWNSVNRLLAEQDAAIALLREAQALMESARNQHGLVVLEPTLFAQVADRIDAMLADKEPT